MYSLDKITRNNFSISLLSGDGFYRVTVSDWLNGSTHIHEERDFDQLIDAAHHFNKCIETWDIAGNCGYSK